MDSSPKNMINFITKLLRMLECPVCMEYISPPVRQCREGHILCESCRNKLSSCPICEKTFSDIRIRLLDDIAEAMLYPCSNEGCDVMLSFKERTKHELSCNFPKLNKGIKSAVLQYNILNNIVEAFPEFFKQKGLPKKETLSALSPGILRDQSRLMNGISKKTKISVRKVRRVDEWSTFVSSMQAFLNRSNSEDRMSEGNSQDYDSDSRNEIDESRSSGSGGEELSGSDCDDVDELRSGYSDKSIEDCDFQNDRLSDGNTGSDSDTFDRDDADNDSDNEANSSFPCECDSDSSTEYINDDENDDSYDVYSDNSVDIDYGDNNPLDDSFDYAAAADEPFDLPDEDNIQNDFDLPDEDDIQSDFDLPDEDDIQNDLDTSYDSDSSL